VLLDLSAAFDTVDHTIFLQQLQRSYGICGSVLDWLQSYLLDRTQHVRRGSTISSSVHFVCGVPQSSVIGPILIGRLGGRCQKSCSVTTFYSHDTQIYGSCPSSHIDVFLSTVTECVNDVADWRQSNHLQHNNDKTEFLWFTMARRQHRLPTFGPTIGLFTVTPSSTVRDLGVYIDADFSMQRHVRRTVSRCFAVLRQLRSVRRQTPPAVFQSLIVTLVLSRLDYYYLWTACIPHPPSPICSECCCVAHIRNPSVRAHHRRSHQPKLVAHS